MTDIPGTGRLTQKKLQEEIKHNANTLSVVNVREIKKKDWQKPTAKDSIWYNTLKYWIIFGCIAAIPFLLLSLYQWSFLLIVPLGPLIGFIAWHVKRLGRKLEKVDPLSKLS